MNENNDKKIVAIYTRVSTDGQVKDGYGLKEQKERIYKHCEDFEYEVYKLYEEPGVSAKNTEDRAVFNEMIRDMKKNKFNMIVALKIDRVSRDLIDFLSFMKDVKEYNCDVEFILDKVDTSTASGRMIMNVLGVFAQFERELIIERTIDGIKGAIEEGHYGGRPPLGYKKEEKGKRWVIDEENAKVVREIFNLCASGKTYSQIVKIMQQKYSKVIVNYKIIDKKKDIKEPIYKEWKDSNLSVILNNKAYIGIYEWGKRVKDKEIKEMKGFIEPIVSEDIFYECQKNIERNKRNYYRTKKYLFVQKLLCPICHKAMAADSGGKDYLYYKCNKCNETIRDDFVAKIMIEKLTELLEMFFIIDGSYFAMDSRLAEEFNSCRVDNRFRFAIDSNIIEEKLSLATKSETLMTIWDMASYEVRRDFIMEYIDTIEVRKINKKGFKYDLELVDLKLRANKIQKLFELKEKNMQDMIIAVNDSRYSKAEFKTELEAKRYIDILSRRYSIKTIDLSKDKDYVVDNDLLFKIIDIKPTRKVEKEKTLYLILCGENERNVNTDIKRRSLLGNSID